MLPFLLYLATGIVTATHLYVLLSLAVVGAPHNGLEFVALVGSLVLAVSGYISLSRPQAGAKLALPGALVSWSFYGPAILATGLSGGHREIINARIAALPYLAVALLVSATIYSATVSFREAKATQKRKWIFPESTPQKMRTVVKAGSLTLLLALAVWVGFGKTTFVRRASRFLIPPGYVGWVKVEFQVPGAEPLPLEEGHYDFRIPADGLLQTSSAEQFGSSNDKFYYTSGNQLEPLPGTGASERRIWGRMNGQAGMSTTARNYEQFFVGTQDQFKQHAGEPKIGSISSQR